VKRGRKKTKTTCSTKKNSDTASNFLRGESIDTGRIRDSGPTGTGTGNRGRPKVYGGDK